LKWAGAVVIFNVKRFMPGNISDVSFNSSLNPDDRRMSRIGRPKFLTVAHDHFHWACR
jgi:hypothetical protein